jgi:hypothetical protein
MWEISDALNCVDGSFNCFVLLLFMWVTVGELGASPGPKLWPFCPNLLGGTKDSVI